jgi:para-aminobenzoate synthetase component 1
VIFFCSMSTATSQARLFSAQVEELLPRPNAWDLVHLLADRPNLIFLDSALTGASLARYSYLSANPFAWLSARGEKVWLDGKLLPASDPFAVLGELLGQHRLDSLDELPPFQGGAAGLFGYDLCHHLERLPRPRIDDFETPDLAIGLYDWVIAFDHVSDRAWIISTGLPESDPDRRQQRARKRIQTVQGWLRRSGVQARPFVNKAIEPASYHPLRSLAGLGSSFTREAYLQAIRRAIEYVHAGDCFQVNLAQRLLYPAALPPLELYHRLRQRNPAPFAGYLDGGEFVIASASPERFVRVRGGLVETRPIKGTRPRGFMPEEDLARADDLLESVKDRAENVMIVDLLRNDLGRVCEYGSIKVEDVCRLESYRTVHHLVSEVHGALRPGLGPIDLLRATFPGGSVTGAPKVRAMEIIAELEPVARGPYCGSLGWIGFDGSMDSSILIRTFTIGEGWIQFPVGGGIVADSEPISEYAETLHKAEGLLRALQ